MYISDVKTKTTVATGNPEILTSGNHSNSAEGNKFFVLRHLPIKEPYAEKKYSKCSFHNYLTYTCYTLSSYQVFIFVTGPVIGRFCMDFAIKKAKEAGIGWVSARGSNHFGIAGWYGLHALKHGMIGMAFTNTSPLLVPTRAKQEVLGTNPICVAAPAKDGDSFVFDMANCRGVRKDLADRKDQPIPVGWAVDKDGKSTTDPKQATGLSPLEGAENTYMCIFK
ncbi:uncharacterized oxidoreductase YjmC-like [Ruditapes philippinarum]|uniref:uncharacterized oxidoreductase YjmC-like n=1 Tax=Ruditapes philippinarum TaxID=129788 RepID=UPI00295BFF5F|nr:uncharacterized oxidoreductase YjmC-like [Ruditapes philippinarum]